MQNTWWNEPEAWADEWEEQQEILQQLAEESDVTNVISEI